MFRLASGLLVAAVGAALVLATDVPARAASADPTFKPRFGFGRVATPQEIAGWDIDVRPDGHGVKKGRGTVEQGQAIYDAKCASCHGTFGESNDYMMIAGGVGPKDLETGRASELLRPDGVRTVGTKLNHASTLWDYINRAMPWTAPQSLTVDEVYAVTAYVLHLNGIVPADFELSDRNLLTVKMPNRNGMTTKHGMGSVRGKPDVQGVACMINCRGEVAVTSEMPTYAMNAHGNLAQQIRTIGPVAGIDTTRFDTSLASRSAAGTVRVAANAAPSVQDLMNRQACVACHAVDKDMVGPSFDAIRLRYEKKPDAETYLADRIRQGGAGQWGQVAMPAQQSLSDAELRTLARWILRRTTD